MKVSELLEKKLEFKTSKKPIHGIIQSKQLNHLGTGVTAIAYEHKKRPNTVIKTIQLIDKTDVTFAFVRLCINNKQNPFLPKIYAAKVYNVKQMDDDEREQLYQLMDPEDTPPDQGKYVMVVVMEKLYPIHNAANRAVATQLLQQLNIVPTDPAEIPQNLAGVRDPLSITNRKFANPFKRQELKQGSSNVQFKQALRLLEPLFKYSEADLHKKNIMLRMTNDGPHLVLVDPVITG